MKTCTVLSRLLLLVVVLAVSWAAAVPLPDDSSETELQNFLNSRPFTPYPFNQPSFNHYPFHPYPNYGGSRHVIVIDPYSLVSFLGNNERWADQDSSEESEEDQKHDRRKRQTTLGFGMNRGPFGRDYHASVGYNRHFNNGRTSLGVHGHRNWGASGKSHGFGIRFSHRFRR